ncbi:MAG: sigma-70 family RNA polymerase sigma factor [Bacteroidia bacterium]|nr:sigma-70 family RNA polymerase sigma factor [Bacteroidia bacterium]
MLPDENLIDGCIAGKREFQKILYDRFGSKMLYVCFRYCKNREEAEDVLQDGFVKVFNNISKFRKEGSLEGWIRRIMVNTALENLRKQKSIPKITDIEDERINTPSEMDAVGKLHAKDLMAMIDKLPPGYKLVFNLFAIEGYSHQEIAGMLNITEGTSKSQLSKARDYLKKNIAGELVTPKIHNNV